MPKVSVNILTKNRAHLLRRALESVECQTFKDFEVVVINDASTDNTAAFLNGRDYLVINQEVTKGITFNRQLALEKSSGDYIAILDDDDQWCDVDKLKKQVECLEAHPEVVVVGGAIAIQNGRIRSVKFRPLSDLVIRQTMLLRNNFFTSTVMFRRQEAIKAGGFAGDGIDLAEDYDLWLRMGKLGQLRNFNNIFTQYSQNSYNKAKFVLFLTKQFRLIKVHKSDYPGYFISALIIRIRILLNS